MVIKLHAFHDDEEFLVNTEKISCVRNYSTGSNLTIEGYGMVKVKEDMAQIMQMMVEGFFKKGEGDE